MGNCYSQGISNEEIEILAEIGARVTHAPPGRSTPVIEMPARGVNLAVTSDGTAPSSYFDMLQIARSFQSTQIARSMLASWMTWN